MRTTGHVPQTRRARSPDGLGDRPVSEPRARGRAIVCLLVAACALCATARAQDKRIAVTCDAEAGTATITV